MIELKDVLNIHNILIDKFGGRKGIRAKVLLNLPLIDHLQPSVTKFFIRLLATKLKQFLKAY